jgi:hypothetical protein
MPTDDVTIDAQEAQRIAYHAAIAGYPIVLLDEARRRHPAPANEFHHDWGRRAPALAHANPHVLYSTAWLDLADGPVVLSTPRLNAANLVVTMLDARGRVFSSAGARMTGALPAEIAIVGPNWGGDVGRGMKAIRAATNTVWLVARTPIDHEDPEISLTLQRQMYLTAIRRQEPAPPVLRELRLPRWPARTVATLDAETFFQRLGEVFGERPTSGREAALIEELARIGFTPGRPFELPATAAIAQALRDGLAHAQHTIASHPFAAEPGGAWAVYARHAGETGDPLTAAAAIHNGLALNLAEDAVYFVATSDNEGRPLSGAHRYRLHFDQYRTPQVEGSWSLTAYDLAGELTELSGDRFGLSSRDRLRFNADGSIDLRIQRNPPVNLLASNWAPCPPGDFRLVLRAYWPRQSILSGAWRPPAPRRLHEQLHDEAANTDDLVHAPAFRQQTPLSPGEYSL